MALDQADLGYYERRPGSGIWYKPGDSHACRPKTCEGCGDPFMGDRRTRFCTIACSKWKSDPGYAQRHRRVRLARGSASQFPCVDGCGRLAVEWSQIHGTDGLDVDAHYEPRCKLCHSRYDADSRPRGESQGLAVLTEARVRGIRASVGANVSELARLHGVSRKTIRNVLSRKIWRHI